MKYLFILISLLSFVALAAEVDNKADEEAVNQLICPENADRFLDHGKKTYTSMMDLYLSQQDQVDKYSEWYTTILEFKKNNSAHQDSFKKIQELKISLSQKVSRAKEIYNNQVLVLASEVPKTKKCWKYHEEKKKKKVSEFLESLQNKKILQHFKECVSSQQGLIADEKIKLALAEDFFESKINRTKLLTDSKKIQEKIVYRKKYAQKKCDEVVKSGFKLELQEIPISSKDQEEMDKVMKQQRKKLQELGSPSL